MIEDKDWANQAFHADPKGMPSFGIGKLGV
jgi:hypothetical protein